MLWTSVGRCYSLQPWGQCPEEHPCDGKQLHWVHHAWPWRWEAFGSRTPPWFPSLTCSTAIGLSPWDASTPTPSISITVKKPRFIGIHSCLHGDHWMVEWGCMSKLFVSESAVQILVLTLDLFEVMPSRSISALIGVKGAWLMTLTDLHDPFARVVWNSRLQHIIWTTRIGRRYPILPVDMWWRPCQEPMWRSCNSERAATYMWTMLP